MNIQRLARLDHALASDLGVILQQFAALEGISTRSVRRDLDTLREMGGSIPRGVSEGELTLFRYDDGCRVFAEWIDGRENRKTKPGGIAKSA